MRHRTVAIATLALACLAACGGPAPTWTMPDLVGQDLQSAQDAIQELTDFAISATVAHDASGAGREQVLDEDWTVCTQSVAAGTTIDSDTMIDFAVVQCGEPC